MEDTLEKESAAVAQEGDERVEDTRLTTSTSTVASAGVGGEAPKPSDDDDSKTSFRLPYASRKTVEDLETEAHQGDKMLRKSLSRASTTSSAETQPGAVAMYRSDSDATTDMDISSVSGDVRPEGRETEDCCAATAARTDPDEVPMIPARLAGDTHAPQPLVIEAQLAEDPPEVTITIPQARLVMPPQEAFHVQFDEEAPPPPDQERPRHAPENDIPHPEVTKFHKMWHQHGKHCFRFSVLLLVVGLIAGIIAPRVHEEKRSEDLEDHIDWLEGILEFGGDLPIVLSAPTPAPSSQSVYDCYDSTLKIALAQAEEPSKTKYILCPNILIPIGHLNDDNKIEGGDYPLTALGDSVEIQCGLSGRRENHCVLEGGFLQVLLQPSLPDKLAGEVVNRTDSVVFRGITFRGDLNASHENIGGVSVLANNPGDVTFVDCEWQNMTAPHGLAQIGDNNDAMTFAPTTDVTFEDCSFTSIVYDGPFIGVYGQSVTVRQSLFEDITLPPSIEPCQVGEMDWCQGLLYCFEESVCNLEDICVEGLEYAGPAAIATASSQTNMTVSGAKQSYGLNLHPSVDATSSGTTCSTGLAQFEDPEYLHPECWLESGNWTSTDFCLIKF